MLYMNKKNCPNSFNIKNYFLVVRIGTAGYENQLIPMDNYLQTAKAKNNYASL